MEKAPVYPADQAILICVSLTPAAVGQWQACYNGKSVGVTRGGFKYSGVGREYGQYGIGAFLEPKAILE
jgi:hypothetical protein